VVYGIVIMQPTAPMGFYGMVSNVAGGHVVTTILIAGVAMLFTALSYGRMARVYPSAGSAYTYVGKELNPVLGFIVGWSLLMDYVLNPIICAIWFGAAAQNVLPSIPFAAWAISFVILHLCRHQRCHSARPDRSYRAPRHGRPCHVLIGAPGFSDANSHHAAQLDHYAGSV
jgi:amino acid transporter